MTMTFAEGDLAASSSRPEVPYKETLRAKKYSKQRKKKKTGEKEKEKDWTAVGRVGEGWMGELVHGGK